MNRLRLVLKPKLKITQRYIEKLVRYSMSYQEIQKQFKTVNADTLQLASQGSMTLEETLMNQLEYTKISEKDKQIMMTMIEELDETGLFTHWESTKLALMKRYQISEHKTQELLKLFQEFEPEGVGARAVGEYLAIQVRRYELEDEPFRELLLRLLDHEQEIVSLQTAKLTKVLHTDTTQIALALHFLRLNLNPVLPGRQFIEVQKANYISLSAKLTHQNGQFVIEILENYDFIENPLLRQDLNERKQLLLKIIEKFCAHQKMTFFDSMAYLCPMTQKEIADELGLSYSTISRLVNKKYLLIGKKTICLRSLLQPCIAKSGATRYFFKNIFEQYADQTDKKIQLMLQTQGINVSRRTVNYYRHQTKALFGNHKEDCTQ